jgi:hypothetical protein
VGSRRNQLTCLNISILTTLTSLRAAHAVQPAAVLNLHEHCHQPTLLAACRKLKDQHFLTVGQQPSGIAWYVSHQDLDISQCAPEKPGGLSYASN